jgi:hypothetical protein
MRKILNIEDWKKSPQLEVLKNDILGGILVVKRLKDNINFSCDELVALKQDCDVWRIVGFISDKIRVYVYCETSREGKDTIVFVNDLIKFK